MYQFNFNLFFTKFIIVALTVGNAVSAVLFDSVSNLIVLRLPPAITIFCRLFSYRQTRQC